MRLARLAFGAFGVLGASGAWLAVGCGRPTTESAPATSATSASTAPPVATSGAPEPAPSASAAVEPTAASDAPRAPLGSCGLGATLHRAPNGRFSLALANGGPSALRLVLPGDGSEAGWRTPTLAWTATSGGEPVAVEAARCGMTNPIEAKEIFTLAPGAERRITEWVSPPGLPPGAYDLRLTYRNDPALAGGKVTVAPDAKRPLETSSACEVTTPPLRVSVP